MRQSHTTIDNDSTNDKKTPRSREQSKAARVIQIFVFKGDEYLGWDCFCKERVSIGSDSSADLVLKDDTIIPHHAEAQIDGNGDVLISFLDGSTDTCTDSTIEQFIMQRFDSVEIGPYTLKIKELKNRSNNIVISSDSVIPAPESYENQHASEVHREEVQAENSDEGVFLEQEDSYSNDTVIPAPESYENEPVPEVHIEEVQPEDHDGGGFRVHEETTRNDTPNPESYELEPAPGSHREEAQPEDFDEGVSLAQEHADCEEGSLCVDVKSQDPLEDAQNLPDHPMMQTLADEDDEDEEDEDEAWFCLKDRLTLRNVGLETCTKEQTQAQFLIEVVKSRNGRVLDVRFLKRKQRYYIKTDEGRFCLAENKGKDGHYFYFDDHFTRIARSSYSAIAETDQFCIHEKLYNKKKGIYSDKLRLSSMVILYDDPFEYHLRCVEQGKSPEVEHARPKDTHYYKHFIKSTVLHVIALTIIGMLPSYTPEPEPVETHFVQVDPLAMEEINKRIALPPPPKPKEDPVPVQPEPKKTVKKPVKKKQVTTPKKKVVASKSPKAGGGYGKGNIKNRNIKQAGLLSMLGDNIGLKPQEAMAAVTNLDAVSSMQESTADFKVGGIVGKLGTAKIEIPQSGIVSTKGSSQVLRSAGARGEGRVAALEKGVTGEGQVMAMVSAEMDKAVKIQGGMSREAVKKVIDKHLDEITYCYETALIANPSLMGKVVFEWKILLSGNVGEIRIKTSSINSSEIHACIKGAIKSWQFPKPKGNEVIVSYPFIFDIVGF